MTRASLPASSALKARVAPHRHGAAATAARAPKPADPAPRPVPPQRRWQRWLRIEPIADIHAAYDFFRDVTVHGHPLHVVSWPSTRHHIYWPRALRVLLPPLNHLAMLLGALRAPKDAVLLVREFDNLWLLLLAPAFWPLRRRMVLNINHNFRRPPGRGLAGWALRAVARLGFRMLWLDGAAALPDVRPSCPRLEVATPWFPVSALRPHAHPAPRTAADMLVGIVGYFREDKGGLDKLLDVTRELHAVPGVRVAVGFWNESQRLRFTAAADAGIATCSTFAARDYHAFLARCDALVILAEADAYYYRHSGILMDTIGHGTIPICPAYPLLTSIVTQPAAVGAVYGSPEDLSAVVQRVIAQRDRLAANFRLHARARNCAQVGAALEALLRAEPRGRSSRSRDD
jgi:hypothetical protein